MQTTDVDHYHYGEFRAITNDAAISHHVIRGVIWAEHILDVIVQHIKPNTTIVDVGANIGTHTVGIIQKLLTYPNNESSRIIAIEPQPEIFNVLTHNVMNRGIDVECLQCGIGRRNGVAYMENPDYNTCANPGGIAVVKDPAKSDMIQVQLKTLDRLKLSNVSFMKIDVEGSEIDVIDGARTTIRQCRPVMVVHILGGVDPSSATPEQLVCLNTIIKKIEGYKYTVQLIQAHDYLCVPL